LNGTAYPTFGKIAKRAISLSLSLSLSLFISNLSSFPVCFERGRDFLKNDHNMRDEKVNIQNSSEKSLG
jgi:hypothetical protein